mmetsp:Transcript_11553/g.30891  ORF Transcript_11553/g.30891 Transcript_11553/m.30891 type:complete len:466 (+) Transcript_11553:96-1493(+)|eukprot:CAMPEP_0117562690 /NCGR_PEP_ID=MMETSP0784-20121206/55091_1 /TAXON_ID=39447 /ORGANISM="" /LENGTH=465 /DNA_ID=CAMNT_0005360277 /DNA_START=90 /DNA_END=1487 /DNA_ORIENTATION=+
MSGQKQGPSGRPPRRKLSAMGASLLKGGFPSEMNMFETNITGVLFFDKAPEVDVIAKAFEKHLWPCERFSCCVEDGCWVNRHSEMDRSYHFQQQDVTSEAEIEALAMNVQLTPLDRSYPLWRIWVLNNQGWTGMSAVIMNVHHCVGDGIGMLFAMSPLIGVKGGDAMSMVPLPRKVLPPAMRKKMPNATKKPTEPKKSCFAGFKLFFKGCFVSLLSKHDAELTINPPLAKRTPFLPFSGKRVYTRLTSIPMSSIQAVRARHGCSMNDVVMAALAGALRRYAIEVREDTCLKAAKKPIECNTLVMIGLPRKFDSEHAVDALQNKMLFASARLPVDKPTPRERMESTLAAYSDLKCEAYMTGLVCFTTFLTAIAPSSVLAKAAGETWSKHTLCVTNVPSTTVEMTWPADGGQPVRAINAVIANVMPQVSLLSYNGRVYASLVADPALFPEPEKLSAFWEAEFDALAE